MDDFYVYLHLRADGTPFYVGKGKGLRYRNTKNGRNNFWWRIVKKDYPDTLEPESIILKAGLNEETAFVLEKFWIKVFGRRTIDEGGVLVNKTEGGTGNSGLIHTEETKEKMRQKALGRKHTEAAKKKMSAKASLRVGEKAPSFGKKHSEETKKKISENNNSSKLNSEQRLEISLKKGAKPIFLEGPDGIVVEVINKRQFCKEHSVHNAHLYEMLAGKRKRVGQWRLTSKHEG